MSQSFRASSVAPQVRGQRRGSICEHVAVQIAASAGALNFLVSQSQQTIARWYTQVVSLSEQVMRFPSDLSAFLKPPAVSPRERHGVL